MLAAALFHGDAPAPICFPVQADDLAVIVNAKSWLALQMLQQQVGQGAVVDVGSRDHPRRRERFTVVTPLHDQRRPCRDGRAFLGVFHAVIAMVDRHLLEPRLQEGDVLLAPNEAHVRAWVDEGPGIGNSALLHQEGPELA